MANSKQKYKAAIAEFINVSADNVFLFNKGRVALYTILKAYGIKEGDEIIIPAFTCVVVPNAIIYCGATPVYVDIEPKSFNIDVNLIESKITSKTKVIIAQNTFGLAPDFDALKIIADKYNLHLIEDCTHGFGGSYSGKKNGTITEASFFSTQWNKPFSTGIGGFAIVNDKQLKLKIAELSKDLIQPSVKEELLLSGLIKARKYLLKPFIYFTLVHFYRLLSKFNIVPGSSSNIEIISVEMPEDYFKGSGNVQANEGLQALSKLNLENKARKQVAEKYNVFFKRLGYPNNVIETSNNNNIFLKYPILVKDREFVFEQAQKYKIELGDWFISPIHPVLEDLGKWKYKKGENKKAEFAAQHIINLPVSSTITDAYYKRMELFLIKIQSQFIINS